MGEIDYGKYISRIAYTKNIYEGVSKWDLENLNQINLFIGPNNSGKSRIIRQLFSDDFSKYSFDYHNESNLEFNEKVVSSLQSNSIEQHRPNDRKIYSLADGMRRAILTNKNNHDLKSYYNDFIEHYIRLNNSIHNANPSHREFFLNKIFKPAFEEIESNKLIQSLEWKKCYVPTLRTLRTLSESEKDLCLERTLVDYFENNDDELNDKIFTGHSIYKELQEHLLGEHSKRERIKEYEEYLSSNFFFGREVSLVPRIGENVVYFKEGDLDERPIYDLGDGIQSIIILTFRLFMAEEPTVFVIEEPEHFLHAGLQRRLLETFSQHKQHMFFISTHSNHFLDYAQESNDVSVQNCYRENNETKVQSVVEMQDTLTSLGVRASSVLLANSSIWVEGITDRLYLSFFLKRYIEEDKKNRVKLESLKENLHYIFVEYQGNNIVHWSFAENEVGSGIKAESLSKYIYLIGDGDSDKGNRIKTIENSLGDNFEILDRKEIENYVPASVIKKVAEKIYKNMDEKTKNDTDINRFQEIDNNTFDNLDHGIGRILDGLVNPSNKQLFGTSSGTIKNKVKFCHKAIEIMKNDSDFKLTPELNKICENIWSFIQESNSSEFDSKR